MEYTLILVSLGNLTWLIWKQKQHKSSLYCQQWQGLREASTPMTLGAHKFPQFSLSSYIAFQYGFYQMEDMDSKGKKTIH